MFTGFTNITINIRDINMTDKAVIRLNDITDHGGKVITAIDNYVYQGVPIAANGYLAKTFAKFINIKTFNTP